MCLFTRFGARKHSRPTRIFMSVLQSKGTNHKGHEGNLVRNHSLYFRRVRIADQSRATKPALTFLIFGSQDVTQKCVRPLDFPTSGFFEALGRAFVCLQFWHRTSAISTQQLALAKLVPQGQMLSANC